MTITEAKQKLVSWALAQVGYVEGANNWNKYAPTWTEAGGWNAQNQPWCDVFVDAGFIECFGLNLAAQLTYQRKGAFSALCATSAQYYKNNGAWYTSPEVGDQVFFNVSGGINHTGIVVGVSGGIVTTVEGNSSDAVRKQSYPIASSCVAGFGRPDWSAVFDTAEASSGISPAADSAAVQDTYTVQPGDTLYAIAKKYHTTVDKICKLNKIKETTILQIGRKLRVK